MQDVELNSVEDEEDEVEMPIFTSELAALKDKEKGIVNTNPAPIDQDEEMGDSSDDGVDDVDKPPIEDNYPEEFSDSEEEKDDYSIRKSDAIIVTATAESDHSNLEVYIYEH
mmetsp:Transcript_19724/g.14174  ORF Transcript_19724/g.14174 Transcript_19724/m.14174 type:complete len:112 (+) Transcript_19724:274-609(+)|eukprot:CAMPEP_0116885922 /NCGR_PEP_ID=MMETSP0463-20121206/19557_1 /TAXON_ID=181622 /ORGANISM="Strombidinopsis sp, Strain SopsisLIS2011" /LENGTH=111 /DNA_ID=CAMNT_0004545397 /DNA_START=204 /DNA_END=539 /DNA_ORIENTATION=+